MKISTEEVNRLLAFMPAQRGSVRQRIATGSTLQNEAPQNGPAATVEISSDSQVIQQVKRVVNQMPDVREARVRELKAQVESGTYHVSGEDIADLIIRRALADNTAL